jgi:hypothetical protein
VDAVEFHSHVTWLSPRLILNPPTRMFRNRQSGKAMKIHAASIKTVSQI